MVSRMKFDAVVVGDNFAGYTAAALLAHHGISCSLIADPDLPDSRSRIVRTEGFSYDFGVLSDRFVGLHPEKILKALGIPVRFHHGGCKLFFNGSKLVPLADTMARSLTSSLLGLKGKTAWPRIYWNLMQQHADPYKYKKSVADWLLNVPAADQDLTDYISLRAASALDVPALERVALGTFIDALRETCGGPSVVPLGGWEFVFKELENVIRKHGDVMSGMPFTGLMTDGDRVRGVCAGDDKIEAEFVIAALPVRSLIDKIKEESFKEEWGTRLKKLEPVSGISLHLGLDRPVTSARGEIITSEPFTRGLAVSNTEPSLAPRGCQLLTWFMPVPETVLQDEDALKNSRLQIKEILELLFPGVMERVIGERWNAHVSAGSAISVLEQTREELPPMQVFKQQNALMVNDAVNIGECKGETSLRAAAEAAAIAEKQVRKQ
jgi:phytoene dehydrogenase-like protein